MMLKALLLIGLSAVVSSQDQDLMSVLNANSQLSQLAHLVEAQPQITASLKSASNVTVLAPNNDAIMELLDGSAAALLAASPDALAALLSYHILSGTYSSSQITNKTAFITTQLNDTNYANVTGGQQVEAVSVGGNATFFSGLNRNSTVVQANQNFTNGVLHVINRALTLPTKVSTTLVEANLTALWGALDKTKLLDTVDSLKDVTIFAPNNGAFATIGSAIAYLSDNDLSRVMTYHVVNGSSPNYSPDLKDGTSLKTVNGGTVTVHVRNGTTFINGAKVVSPDLLVAGGVVHIIDEVLNPANSTASAASSATTGAPAYSSASSTSNVPFTSGAPTPHSSIGGGAAGATSTSSKAAAQPMRTGAVCAAMLFGAGAAAFANI